MARRGQYPHKCFDCGEPHKHRNQNTYPYFCKPCATKFMLKGRYKQFSLWCFGSLNCPEDYKCPLQHRCMKVYYYEIMKTPQVESELKGLQQDERLRKWRARTK